MFYEKSNKIMQKLDLLLNVINTFCLSALVILCVVQIFLRYVLKLPLLGIEELMTYPTIWLYLIGGASASLRDEHIECGMIETFSSNPKIISLFKIIKYLFSFIISGVVCIFAFQMAQYSFKLWKVSGTLYIPMFYAEVAIFVGLLFMFICSILHLWGIIATINDRSDIR